ncbi:S1 family peptidase [Micromonospora sp. WMMD558]
MLSGNALARRSAVLLGVIAVVIGAALPAAAVPAYDRNEPATAVASPSTVYLESTYTGYLRDARAGTMFSREPVVVTRRCSGVVVSPDGYAVTTTVCVQPSSEVLLVNALYRLGRTLVQEERLAADELDAYVARLKDSSAFTGRSRGTAPTRTLVGQLDVAIPEAKSAPAVTAAVTTALTPVDGNVALVKLRRAGLPAVEIATASDLLPGAPAVILGYGRDETDDGAVRYVVRTRAVEIVGRSGTNRIGVNGQIGPDSRGGPVVDESGRLVAVLDTDTSAPGEPVRDLITAATIGRLLEQGGVEARLGGADRAFRGALGDYFGGRYSQAVRGFDDVLEQDPARSSARIYRKRAQERLRLDGDVRENAADWMLYLLSAASGALIIGGTNLAQRLAVRPAQPASKPAGGESGRGTHDRRPPERTTPLAASPAPTTRPAPPAAPPAGPVRRPPVDDDATVVLSLDATVILPLDRTVILPRIESASEPQPARRRTARPAPAPPDGRHLDWRGHHDGR